MARFTLSFRGKLWEDGTVKVPRITSSHVSLRGNEDTTATIFATGRDEDIRKRWLGNMLSHESGLGYWPGWASEDKGFTIRPIGNGFMADVSVELDTNNMQKRAES